MSTILVTGGTGVLGREVVTRLQSGGNTVRVMSRKPAPAQLEPGTQWAQADLETGSGLAEAVHGVDIIINCASNSANSYQSDVVGTAALLKEARQAQVGHVLHISIVGIERIPSAYYMHKVEAEAAVVDSGVAYSILRATQFHTLIDMRLHGIVKRSWLPILPVPTDYKYQLVDPGEVADAVVRYALAGPHGRLTDMGGPAVQSYGEIARAWLGACHIRRLIVHVPVSGAVAKGFRAGYNTTPEHRDGNITWSDYLLRKYGSRQGEHSSQI